MYPISQLQKAMSVSVCMGSIPKVFPIIKPLGLKFVQVLQFVV